MTGEARHDYAHVTFISAGAGSGKTYRLTQELEKALTEGGIAPSAVIGTTFTVKAAGELKERVRSRLIESGRIQLAEQMAQALIGTVHSVCERLLQRFAFELGLSPALSVMSLEDGQRFFNQALDDVLSLPRVREMNALAARLGQEDWQAAVKAVADKVRENDLGPQVLPAMARESADAMLGFFGAPRPGPTRAQLLRTVEDALARIDPDVDATATTRKYLATLRQARHRLRREDCPWSVWIRLACERAAKASEPIAAAVRDVAAQYESHPALHDDVRRYIDSVMEIAGRALERFAAIKTEHGLIDFLDMEQLTLHALDQPAVRERLAEELELLMVDEFQDTNPMQLALFVKLAALADRVIFVGDVKQAIYAFRGCDPDLVFRTLEAMTRARAEADKLPYSWRSRPALVHYVNAVFGAAFAEEIPREQVVLEPKRAEPSAEPAVVCWKLAGGRNKESRAEALAQGIVDLVASGTPIVDPGSGALRPVSWGDIAVLARTNDNVQLLARTLKNRGVPMKMTLKGLLETPEVCLARACLRRLNDVTDTLATAEIVSLADSAEPEAWLADRLAHLGACDPSGSSADGETPQPAGHTWGEDRHPIVRRLAELRAESALHSPVEIVARVLNDVGTRRIVTGWGPDAIKAAQRQRNLDAFLDLAVKYEDHCAAHHQAASLTGFLFWLEKPSSPELDLQPVVTSGDAVHVLTYHRAKGLEWPVVVAADFDKGDPSSIWDVRVLTGPFDVSRPLENRTIRFWPNLFGDRSNNLPVLERILDSDEGRRWRRGHEAEQRRLAYVGITRARDLLVLALPSGAVKSDRWLHTFAPPWAVPAGERLDLPDGPALASALRELDGRGEAPALPPYRPRWFPRRERIRHPRLYLNPSAAEPLPGTAPAAEVDLGGRLPVGGDDMAPVGSALHAVIAAEIVNPGRDDAVERARQILEAYGAAAWLRAEDAVQAARRLRAALERRYPGGRFRVECPVSHLRGDGSVVRGVADLLIETGSGIVIVDHKSSPRPRAEWHAEALAHSGQLALYRDAVQAAGYRPLALAIHFAIGGGLVFLELGS
ncbi:MAG TPA: UvrD-helicase domain-containing protein [Pseudomonadales bacterium]